MFAKGTTVHQRTLSYINKFCSGQIEIKFPLRTLIWMNLINARLFIVSPLPVSVVQTHRSIPFSLNSIGHDLLRSENTVHFKQGKIKTSPVCRSWLHNKRASKIRKFNCQLLVATDHTVWDKTYLKHRNMQKLWWLPRGKLQKKIKLNCMVDIIGNALHIWICCMIHFLHNMQSGFCLLMQMKHLFL